MEVLLLHTDNDLVNNIKYSFERDGDRVFSDCIVQNGLELLNKLDFDLILLGYSLKDADATQAIRLIKENYKIPIIVLSEDTQSKTAIICLEYGAEDFMTYPIDILELKARIRALKRVLGSSKSEEEYVLNKGPIKLDLIKHEVELNGIKISLTAKEFELLFILSKNPGQIFSREKLAEKLWTDQGDASLRTVDVYIRRLREKLEDIGLDSLVETRWKQGYILNFFNAKTNLEN